MAKWTKQAHVVYQNAYHMVWCPKYRYRILKSAVGRMVEDTLRLLCEWKQVEVMELSVREDHVHLVVSIPPRLSVSEVMGVLKGKTAIKLFKSYPGLKRRPYWGNRFWNRGYCVSTIGMDEEKIRRYVKYQENKEREDEANAREWPLCRGLTRKPPAMQVASLLP